MTTASDELRRALESAEGGRRWVRRAVLAAAFGVAVGGGLLYRVKHRPPPPARYVTRAAEVGDVVEKVQATGAVQPLLQINVGAQVNGRVTRVLVDYNSLVKKGDVLAEIDPRIYDTQVSAQQASLLAQQANLQQARAQTENAKAQSDTARIVYERVQRLYEGNLASKGDLDTAKGQYDAAKATWDATTAALGAAQANVGAQKAQLSQTTTNLGYTKIYSPVDGVVVTRSIDPGATVVASFQTPTLFVIAQDLKKMRVMADVDEADVGKLDEGMPADAVVDAFPGDTFHGIVQQVRYSPNTVSGVVTYSAVIEVDNPEEKLRPGMTATVTVRTHEAKAVTFVPNAALRYRPSAPLAEKGSDAPEVKPAPDAPLPKGQGRVHVLTSDKPGDEREEPRIVPIGITDGANTVVQGGALPPGTKVIIDENEPDKPDKPDKKKR